MMLFLQYVLWNALECSGMHSGMLWNALECTLKCTVLRNYECSGMHSGMHCVRNVLRNSVA